MDLVLSACLGIGLAAACGFRIFVPLLVMSIAHQSGHLGLASGFEWIGSRPALVAFAVATLLEVLAYYVPWLDHLLDTAAVPIAIVAGVVVTASVVTDVSPMLRWSLAVISPFGCGTLPSTFFSDPRCGSIRTVAKPAEAGSMPQTVASNS